MAESPKEVVLNEIDDIIEGHWARRIEADIPLDDFNEVIPGIFIGDKTICRDKEKLLALGVTHVLNAAMGTAMDQIDSTAEFFEDTGIRFHGVCVNDKPSCQLRPHFGPAAEFIDVAVKEGGKVLVHCMLGMSRSTSLVLAYLMMKRSMELIPAIKLLQERRPMDVNPGFLSELYDLDLSLRAAR